MQAKSEIENPSDDLFQTETGETEEAEGKTGEEEVKNESIGEDDDVSVDSGKRQGKKHLYKLWKYSQQSIDTL